MFLFIRFHRIKSAELSLTDRNENIQRRTQNSNRFCCLSDCCQGVASEVRGKLCRRSHGAAAFREPDAYCCSTLEFKESWSTPLKTRVIIS